MNKAESAKIMAFLQTAYPQSFEGISDATIGARVNLWAMQFASTPVQEVFDAVQAYIASSTSPFMPVIGQIKEQLRQLREPQEMTEEEAWGYVSKALRNGIYGYKEEFEKLPDRIQRLVGNPETIKQWAMMDYDTVHSVVASNFKRSFRARAEQDRQYAKLPQAVKDKYKELADATLRPLIAEGGENNDS